MIITLEFAIFKEVTRHKGKHNCAVCEETLMGKIQRSRMN